MASIRARKDRKTPGIDRDTAEAMALTALGFLAEDSTRLSRFLALTGLGPEELRSSASERATLAAVLSHLLADETLLLVFAASKGVAPEAVAPAHALLTANELDRP